MMTEQRRIISQQAELIHRLSWNEAFGCHNRNGFEHMVWPEIASKARWIVYLDVDHMHALNEFYGGYEQVDSMIKQVLSVVRTTDYKAGQFKSGDEFLICLTEREDGSPLDPEGLVKRLQEEFAKHAMSATFAIVPVKSTDLLENVQPAVDRVYELKKQRGVSR